MCCVLTDVHNISPPPFLPGTWVCVLTVNSCTGAAVCSCLIPRRCADSPPQSDIYFFHTSAGEQVLFRFVFLGRAEWADRGRFHFFRCFPIEIDEEVEKYQPSVVSSAACDPCDLWHEQTRLSLHGDSRSPSPRGGEPVLSHQPEIAPRLSDLLKLTSPVRKGLIVGPSGCGRHRSEVLKPCYVFVNVWESERAPDGGCLYIYTLLSGGSARPCFQILNVFGGGR